MAARSGAAPSDAPSDWRALEPVLFSGRGFFGPRAHAEASAFADFYEKYRGALAASAARARAPSGATAEAGPLELPTRYDRAYRLNFRLLAPGGTAHDPLNLAGAPGGRAAIERRLGGEGGVSEARHAVQLYEDFVQRKRFAALHTLWRERRRLPIASYEERIVGSLRDNGARAPLPPRFFPRVPPHLAPRAPQGCCCSWATRAAASRRSCRRCSCERATRASRAPSRAASPPSRWLDASALRWPTLTAARWAIRCGSSRRARRRRGCSS